MPLRYKKIKDVFHGTPLQFIILLGFVSLFADMSNEGAHSITGQYLSILGASALVVSMISGSGELIAYAGRIFSGYLSDKTKKYWFITFIGYFINFIAVPLLAITHDWQTAAFLLILERVGKAIRTPARDAMLSYASNEIGRGKGFGIHIAMDQIGGLTGPLLVMGILFYTQSYHLSYALLGIPGMLALLILRFARKMYPHPHELEISYTHLEADTLPKAFWIYVTAVSLIGMGYVDFPLIAYHFQKDKVIEDIWIPVLYSLGMCSVGLSALIFGRLYDKLGLSVMIVLVALSAFFSLFAFFGGLYSALFGIVLWGIGLGAQGSIMRAYVGNLVSKSKRGLAYGILNAFFGISWFVGSVIIGLLYDVSFVALATFSIVVQLLSIPLLIKVNK